MRLDSKWRKGFEKIQELEGIEDKSIDDDTKRTWLIQTLEGQEDMNNAVRQAITTELTIGGFTRTGRRDMVQISLKFHGIISTIWLFQLQRCLIIQDPSKMVVHKRQTEMSAKTQMLQISSRAETRKF
jgi:hypothetical protein